MCSELSESSRPPSDVLQQQVLEEIEQEIYMLTFWENFSKGWEVLGERCRHRAELIAYKVGVAVGTLLIICFSAGAVLFGSLAMVQAVNVEYQEEGRAPIIGHFSEWTIMGVWAIASWIVVLYNLAFLGKNRLVEEIFHRSIEENPSFTKEIYHEYLEQLKASPTAQYMHVSSIPHPPESEHPSLAEDLALAPVLRDIERELADMPTGRQIREGWKIIKSENGVGTIIALKLGLFLAIVFIIANLINYPLGIYWSAEQAVIDYRHGDIPSIGGHSLEWTVELLGIGGVVWYYLGEMSNVGDAKLIAEVFHKHRKNIFQEDEDKDHQEQSPDAARIAARYETIKKDLIRTLPSGIFFNVHKRFLHRAVAEDV
eukprot:CAMPEP_0201493814 /NCGR_PEP_ID=MMETSP0151_2-20130828/42086_1 /ASSEMBLY_ACC=CAM_ASM_000257 /TAXON_ID=200890 /ORGANISM="Paramoeba atlantica, Strain 621/1 / CCAP 1560/9" /LENGTH=370 /DNA_ID=CAMNT_0047881555 /DNA_START=87 /DNA_END=1199 /DNA_ORIENTATION=+